MVHHTFILPLLAAVIISSHNAVGEQQPTYYPTYWPTYTPTAADDDNAEYGQEKAVQDETSWIDWAKWHADLKAMISGGGSSGGDEGDKSIGGGWPTYYPTYEPTHYQRTENNDRAVPDDDRTLPDSSSSSSGNNNQGNNGQDNNNSNNNNNNNNVPSPTYGPTYVPTTYEPTTMEDRTLYGRQPPKASSTGVNNAYDGLTVTLVTVVIASVTFLFV
jgi:hypothetical protein